MHLPTSTYCRPASIDEALASLAQPRSVVLCGGTDFFPERLHQRRTETIVDISGITELRGIGRSAAGWRIGAATTWREIGEARLPAALDGLRVAARQVGGAQIQQTGTVGGNLCTASPAGDGVPPLMVLDAQVEMQSIDAVRTMPLREFITGYRRTALQPGELLTAIHVPEPTCGMVGSFVKLGARSHLVISIAMVAAAVLVEDGVIVEPRLAVGACSPVARRLADAEDALRGTRCERESISEVIRSVPLVELAPIDDVRAPASYRRSVVPELVADAVVACGVAA